MIQILIEAAEETQKTLPKGRFLPIPGNEFYNSFLGSGGVGIILGLGAKYAPCVEEIGTTYDLIRNYVEVMHYPEAKKFEKGVELEFLGYLRDTPVYQYFNLVQIAKYTKSDLRYLEQIVEDEKKRIEAARAAKAEMRNRKEKGTQKKLDDF